MKKIFPPVRRMIGKTLPLTLSIAIAALPHTPARAQETLLDTLDVFIPSPAIIKRAPPALILSALVKLGLSAADYLLDPANHRVIVQVLPPAKDCQFADKLYPTPFAALVAQCESFGPGYSLTTTARMRYIGSGYFHSWCDNERGAAGTRCQTDGSTQKQSIAYDTVAGQILQQAAEGDQAAIQAINHAAADTRRQLQDNASEADRERQREYEAYKNYCGQGEPSHPDHCEDKRLKIEYHKTCADMREAFDLKYGLKNRHAMNIKEHRRAEQKYRKQLANAWDCKEKI